MSIGHHEIKLIFEQRLVVWNLFRSCHGSACYCTTCRIGPQINIKIRTLLSHLVKVPEVVFCPCTRTGINCVVHLRTSWKSYLMWGMNVFCTTWVKLSRTIRYAEFREKLYTLPMLLKLLSEFMLINELLAR